MFNFGTGCSFSYLRDGQCFVLFCFSRASEKVIEIIFLLLKTSRYGEAHGRAVRALDSESKGPGFESAAGQHLVRLSKVLYSNCSVVWKVT